MVKAEVTKRSAVRSNRVSVKDAAAEIGCAPEYLRRQMKSGRWDIGEVVKPERGKTQYEYFIFRAKLDRFLGNEGEDGKEY
ncbi:MAG: hypothetical protein ACI4DU_04455 [Lachnospiraceae bacterium]